MAKALTINDFNELFTEIGATFEVDEVNPKFAQEERKDSDGNTILGYDGRPRKFDTGEIVGRKYSVTILNGRFKKKSTQVTVNKPDSLITNEEIMKKDSVKCRFVNLQCTMKQKEMYYKADAIELIVDVDKK